MTLLSWFTGLFSRRNISSEEAAFLEEEKDLFENFKLIVDLIEKNKFDKISPFFKRSTDLLYRIQNNFDKDILDLYSRALEVIARLFDPKYINVKDTLIYSIKQILAKLEELRNKKS